MTIAEARAAIESLCPTQPQILGACILSGYDKDGVYHLGVGATWDEAWEAAQAVTLYPGEDVIEQAARDANVG